MTVIWHNPRCSKSRQTLALLQENGVEPEVRHYLKEPPTVAEVRKVLRLLRKSPAEIVRRGEAAYAELGLADASDETLIAAMAANPLLIERPVVIRGRRARLGRPPEAVLELL